MFVRLRIAVTAIFLAITVLSTAFPTMQANAAFNEQINYQGKLTDLNNIAVPNGSYTMVFRLYNVSSGGTALWTETRSVTVTNGLFSVMLGAVTPFGSLDFDQTLYLGVKIGSDSEMSPRKVLGAVPAAMVAKRLGTNVASDFLRSNENDEFEAGKTLTVTGILDTNGEVSFADADITFDGVNTNFSTTGNWSVNTSALSVNKSTGNVGIGTSNPSANLDVMGNIQTGVELNVGQPNISSLHLQKGGGSFGSPKISGNFYFVPGDGYYNDNGQDGSGIDLGGSIIFKTTTGGIAGGYVGSISNRMIITNQGNIGIGVTSPLSMLSVSGGGSFGSGYTTTAAPANGLIVEGGVGIGVPDVSTKLDVFGSSLLYGQQLSSVMVNKTTAYNASPGTGIAFGGNTDSTGITPSIFSAVRGLKENTINFNTAGALGFYTAANDASLVEVGRFSSAGQFGIGTSSPLYKLDVNGGIGVTARFSGRVIGGNAVNSDEFTTLAQLTASTTNAFVNNGNSFGGLATLGTNDNNPLAFKTNGTESMRISTLGKVGIGTSNPATQLEVYGNNPVIRVSGNSTSYYPAFELRALDNNYFTGRMMGYGNSGLIFDSVGYYDFRSGTTSAQSLLRINANGNVGIGTTSPSSSFHVFGTGGIFQSSTSISTLSTLTSTQLGQPQLSVVSRAAAGWTAGLHVYRGGQEHGTFLSSFNTGTGNWSAGVRISNGASNNYFALGTSGSALEQINGELRFFSGTGLTPLSAVTLTERLRIDTSGNVGIDTTSPGYKLDVSGGTGVTARFSGRVIGGNAVNSDEFITLSQLNTLASSTATTTLANTFFARNGNSFGGLATLGTNDANDLAFETNNVTRMRIDAAGRVGIGANPQVGTNLLVSASSSTMPTELFIRNTTTPGQSRILLGLDYVSNLYGGMMYDNSGIDLIINNAAPFSGGDIVFQTGSASKMTLTNEGFLGINSQNPSSLLHVNAANQSGYVASFYNENTYKGISIGDGGMWSGDEFGIYDSTGDQSLAVIDYDGGNTRMIYGGGMIQANQTEGTVYLGDKVGIGNLDPTNTLDVLSSGTTYASMGMRLSNSIDTTNSQFDIGAGWNGNYAGSLLFAKNSSPIFMADQYGISMFSGKNVNFQGNSGINSMENGNTAVMLDSGLGVTSSGLNYNRFMISGNEIGRFDADGLGLGTTNPAHKFESWSTKTSGENYGVYSSMTAGAGATSGTYVGLGGRGVVNGGTVSGSTLVGLQGYVGSNNSTVSGTNGIAVQGLLPTGATNESGASFSNLYAFYGGGATLDSGSATNAYGLYLEGMKATGVTNGYGVYQSGANDRNYFAGNVGIGTSTIAHPLTVSGNVFSSSGTYLTGTNSSAFVGTGPRAVTTFGLSTVGNALITNDIAGARYAQTTGDYDLTWYKHVSSDDKYYPSFSIDSSGPNAYPEGYTFRIGSTATATPAMKIVSSGNVGIGTASPTAKLDVIGPDTGSVINIGNSYFGSLFNIWSAYGLDAFYSTIGSGANYLQVGTAGYNEWQTLGNIRLGDSQCFGNCSYFNLDQGNQMAEFQNMGVAISGSLGVGVMNPQSSLDVNGVIGLRDGGDQTMKIDPVDRILSFNEQGISNEGEIIRLRMINNSMFFKEDGSVGLGTSTPQYLFDVNGGTGITARFSGRVIGGNAVNSNEFVTLSQLTASTSNAFVNNGNSFGSLATLGTNDNNALAFETNGTERMRIGSNGSVSIGTTTSDAALTVVNDSFYTKINIKESQNYGGASIFYATDDYISFSSWGGAEMLGLNRDGNQIYLNSQSFFSAAPILYGGAQIGDGGYNAIIPIGWGGEDGLSFDAGYAQRMVIRSDGKVGIGTSTPAKKLDIADNTSETTLRLSNYSGSPHFIDIASVDGPAGTERLDFRISGTSNRSLMSMMGNGNIGIGTTTPSAMLSLATHTTAAGGINFGDATSNIYRGGTGALKIDGALSVGNSIYVSDGTGLSNGSTGNNAILRMNNNGAILTRNIADSNPAFIIQQANAGSTGDVLQVKNNASTLFSINQGGNLGLGTTTDSMIGSKFAFVKNTVGQIKGVEINVQGGQSVTGSGIYGLHVISNATQSAVENYAIYAEKKGTSDYGAAIYANGDTGIKVDSTYTGLEILNNSAFGRSISSTQVNSSGYNIYATGGKNYFDGNVGIGSNRYLNFGLTSGSSGYGIRDNGGVIEFKNSGGSWTVLGSSGSGAQISPTDLYEFSHFENSGVNSMDPYTGSALASGTVNATAAANTDAKYPGTVLFRSSTTANSGYRVGTTQTLHLMGPNQFYEAILKSYGLSTATTRFGFHDTANQTDATDGVYFELVGNTLVGKTAKAGTRSTTATNYTVPTGALDYYKYRISMNSDATIAYFKVYDTAGSLVWSESLTTNIPTATTNVTGIAVVTTSSGTVASDLIALDYMGEGTVAGYDAMMSTGSGLWTQMGNNVTYTQGSVGIGTTTPTTQLHTTGSVRFSAFGAGTLVTDANGNVSVSSDERLKTVSGEFTKGLNEIVGLKPIAYTWKSETGYDTVHTYYGFSAQNVQAFIPEAVGVNDNGYLTLQDRPLLAASINAIKELNLRVEDIEKIIAQSASSTASTTPPTFSGSFFGSLANSFDTFVDNGKTIFANFFTRIITIVEKDDETNMTGEGIIRSGESSVRIDNPLVTSTSRIIVTPTSPLGGREWYVSEKRDGYFVMSLDDRTDHDITFDYMVISVDRSRRQNYTGNEGTGQGSNTVITPPQSPNPSDPTPPSAPDSSSAPAPDPTTDPAPAEPVQQQEPEVQPPAPEPAPAPELSPIQEAPSAAPASE